MGFTDTVAVGFLHHLLMRGVGIPRDVSVVGVDDTPLTAAAAILLSTIRAPAERIGRDAVATILHPEIKTNRRRSVPKWEWVGRASTCSVL